MANSTARPRRRVTRPVRAQAGRVQNSSMYGMGPFNLGANTTDAFVDLNITQTPSFWAAVYRVMSANPGILDELRANLEAEEAEVQARQDARQTVDGGENAERSDTQAGFRPYHESARLAAVTSELDLLSMWNSKNYKQSLCAIMSSLIRLLTSSYVTSYERDIVSRLILAIHKSADEVRESATRKETNVPFWTLYEKRSVYLRDFSAYRYLLEIGEKNGVITRKIKTDLIMIYVMLTTPDVRIYRDTQSNEGLESIIDPVTGYEIKTAALIDRPLFINMRLDNVFGNVSKNSQLLDKSISTALQNSKRKLDDDAKEEELRTLLSLSKPARSYEVHGFGDPDIQPVEVERGDEELVIREMLEYGLTVSMMAEEFRVFVGDAASRDTKKKFDEPGHQSSAVHASYNTRKFRKPIFFKFSKVNTIKSSAPTKRPSGLAANGNL